MTIRSKKKQPSKETHMIKEELKIEGGVFDNSTVLLLGKLFSKSLISRIDFIIARGKEADVYRAESGKDMEDQFVAIKIFRKENSGFQNRIKYIEGDPRFGGIKSTTFAIVNEWCKKEYGNLLVAEAAKVHAPRPYAFDGNVLVMEFLGEDGSPANMLKHVDVDDPEKVLDTVIEDLRKLHQDDLVHADMSEYNILMLKDVPYLIDFGQAVHIKHPDAHEFLVRDIYNLLHYFSKKYRIERDPDEVLKHIES
jgi:RIO kinase 1